MSIKNLKLGVFSSLAQGLLLNIFIMVLSCLLVSQTFAKPAFDCTQSTAQDIAKAIKARVITSEQCTKQFIQKAVNFSQYNAFITLDVIKVLRQARQRDHALKQQKTLGPLHGVPVVFKDIITTKNYPTTLGTAAMKGFISRDDAVIVTRLLDAGAVLLGKTNIHELAMGSIGQNSTFGMIHNAYNFDYFSGGSSSGSATAVAAGMAPIAIDTDGVGSARMPAGLSGVIAFRPSMKRYPEQGVMPTLNSSMVLTVMAHSIPDIALLDQVITGVPIKPLKPYPLSQLRIGYDEKFAFKAASLAIQQAVKKFMESLRAKGVIFVPIEIEGINEDIAAIKKTLFPYEMLNSLSHFLKQQQTGMTLKDVVSLVTTPNVKQAYSHWLKSPVTKQNYLKTKEGPLHELKQKYRQGFKQHQLDLIIQPTLLKLAPHIPTNPAKPLAGLSHNTMPSAMANLPSIVLPLALSKDGLPMSVELIAGAEQDQQLLRMAYSINALLNPLPKPRLVSENH